MPCTALVWHDWSVNESHSGKLLVATPQLMDPNFHRTVILLIQHDEEGTVGVVLNRETVEAVADHLPSWKGKATGPGLIHYGGPVEPEVAIALSLAGEGMSTGLAGLSMVDLASDPAPDAPSVRIYSGYAGWGAGQLEAELATGSWYVVQASPEDPFDTPGDQWQKVLKRQPGFLSFVSSFPDDVGLN